MLITFKNGELFYFMYGSLVNQVMRDYEDLKTVNLQLEKM